MFNRNSFFIRLLGFVILAGLLVFGGFMLFRLGQAQGFAMSRAAGIEAAPSTAPLAPIQPPYMPYYYRHHFGFLPFGGICGAIFAVLLFFFALRLIFRPRYWGPRFWGPFGWGPHAWGPHGWGNPDMPHDPEKWRAYWKEHMKDHPHGWGGFPWGPPPWEEEPSAPSESNESSQASEPKTGG